MMNCPNCGQPLVGNETQCPRCGIALQPASAQSPWGQPPASTPYPPAGYPPPQGYPPTGQPNAYPPAEAYPPSPNYPPTGQPAYPPSGQYPPTGQPPGYPPTGQYPPQQEYPPQQQPYWTGQPTGQQAPWGGQPTAQPWGMPPAPTPAPSSGGRNVILGIIGAVVVVALIVGGVLFVQHSQHSAPVGTGSNPAATATPSQHIAFQDPLTSNSNGWTDDATSCFFGSGGYHIKGSFICYAPTDDYSNATVSVDVKQISGSGASDFLHGLVFHRTSKGNYYGFDIDANGEWDFFKSVNNNGSEILSPATSSAIKKGLNVSNTLKVAIVGTHYTFFVNGTQVGATDDTTYTTGKTGLDGQDTIEVVYSNFTITTSS